MTYYYKKRYAESWTKTEAASLAGAKRAARQAQASYHDTMLVGKEVDGEMVVLAALPPMRSATWTLTPAGTFICSDLGVLR